ncbi:XRE family transcriptional regulator [Streptomyces sioyaensis]|uniref:MmyB family transcriptional regulator n=1 Tax=Streptomyces sioyaensis TaxID=67364 RepID=UPI0033F56BDB
MDTAALKALFEGARKRAGIVPQERLDLMANRGVGTYRAIISGRNKTPRFDLLADYSAILHLDEQEWTAVCNFGRGEAPPFTLYQDSGLTVPAIWRDVIQGCEGHAAYVTDRAWNLLATNKAFDEIFAGLEYPTNMMRWMALSKDARGIPDDPTRPDILTNWATAPDKPGILTNWATDWAPYVLPQLRAARARFRRDRTLFELERDIIADPLAGPLYAERANANVHPDGDRRPQLHPLHGPGWVTICAAEPLGSAGARVMGVFFTPGKMPTGAPAPLRAAT